MKVFFKSVKCWLINKNMLHLSIKQKSPKTHFNYRKESLSLQEQNWRKRSRKENNDICMYMCVCVCTYVCMFIFYVFFKSKINYHNNDLKLSLFITYHF